MTLLELLKKIKPDFSEFINQEIVDENGRILGNKCFAVSDDGKVFAGGTATEKDLAARIATAEAFERAYLQLLLNSSNLTNEFKLIDYPSSSGFACGFNESSTRFRAICEGVERWIWSKWIDEHYLIEEEVVVKNNLTPLTNYLLKSFDEVFWFKKDLSITVSNVETLNLSILIFLGCKGDGIFPGSRVSTKFDDLYEHPVIEAHRNLTNAILSEKKSKIAIDIIEKRTIFFAHNKILALKQVKKANKDKWPSPEILLLKKFVTDSEEVFLYRCLMKDFMGWHSGEIQRFVY